MSAALPGVVVGVDIGGTKVLAGVVSDDGNVASTAALQRALVGAAHRVVPDLVAAQLGPQAGMIGAALLVAQLRR